MDNDRDLLLVAILTMFTVFLWVFFELVKTSKTSTIAASTQQAIAPFSPKLDSDTLKLLNERKKY